MIFSNKELKKLIVPLIVEQMLVMAVGVIDTAMVSSLGETAVSGVSLVDMINLLLINIFAALATGGAVVVSQYIGHREKERACSAANNLLFVTGIIGVVLMGVSLFFCEPILRVFFGGIESSVMNNAITYFSISAISYPFIAIYNAGSALFRSMGNSQVSMKTSALMNVINCGANALFIFEMGMGVAGAAYGSLIARASAAIVICLLLCSKKYPVHFVKNKGRMIQGYLIKKILYIGIPNGLENGMFQLGRVLVVSIIAGFGTSQIAAQAVANNLDGIGCIPGTAMGLAMVTVIGQCVGAGDYEQAKLYTKKLLKIAYIIMGIVNGLILLLLPLLLKVYNLSDETLRLAYILVFMHSFFAIFFWPLSFVLPNAIRASNDVKYTMIVAIASMWIFRICFSLLLGKWLGFGAIGVWSAMVLDWICRSIFFVKRFRSGKWQRIRLI